jgi:hypothetical protein
MTPEADPQPGTALSAPIERWTLLVELCLFAQIGGVWWWRRSVISAETTLDRITAVAVIGGVLVVTTTILAIAVWRDTHVAAGHSDWTPKHIFWLLVGIVPLAGPLIYILIRQYRTPTLSHGITGRVQRLVSG